MRLLIFSLAFLSVVNGDFKFLSDKDVDRIAEQWDEDDDDDDDPRKSIPPPRNIDPTKMKPEDLMKETKKGQTLMVFVQIKKSLHPQEADRKVSLLLGGLHNAGMEVSKFDVGDNRFILMFTDGSRAYEAKDFLLSDPNCESVTIDGKDYTRQKTEL